MGGLSYIFGRRPLMLASLGFFAVGSAICGAAPNMTTMLIGRSVQGVGGGEFMSMYEPKDFTNSDLAGGILSLAEIIITDLVPLSERGLYYGVNALSNKHLLLNLTTFFDLGFWRRLGLGFSDCAYHCRRSCSIQLEMV